MLQEDDEPSRPHAEASDLTDSKGDDLQQAIESVVWYSSYRRTNTPIANHEDFKREFISAMDGEDEVISVEETYSKIEKVFEELRPRILQAYVDIDNKLIISSYRVLKIKKFRTEKLIEFILNNLETELFFITNGDDNELYQKSYKLFESLPSELVTFDSFDEVIAMLIDELASNDAQLNNLNNLVTGAKYELMVKGFCEHTKSR